MAKLNSKERLHSKRIREEKHKESQKSIRAAGKHRETETTEKISKDFQD
jgi:hypothetical protein